jgi:hypothetical protein
MIVTNVLSVSNRLLIIAGPGSALDSTISVEINPVSPSPYVFNHDVGVTVSPSLIKDVSFFVLLIVTNTLLLSNRVLGNVGPGNVRDTTTSDATVAVSLSCVT